MELSRYVQELQKQLSVAADAAGGDAKLVAERLASTLEATARLVLLEALSDAAGEITAELAPGSVDLRLRGRDPEFVVTAPPRHDHNSGQPTPTLESVSPPDQDGPEGTTSRITLRLPEGVKLRAEAAAAREGLSVNSWLARAVTTALGSPAANPGPHQQPRNSGSRFTGWVR